MESIPLRCLVSKLVAEITPATTRRRSFLVNEITPGIELQGCTEKISSVLRRLFFNMANHVSDTCIRIQASIHRDAILIQLKDPNSSNTYTIAQGLYNAQLIAEEFGGYLGCSSQKKHETTIVFSFPQISKAS